jgi:anti-sigma-K factor RskA
MSDRLPPHDHLHELLAERALFGLSEEEMGELHTLTAGKFDEFNEYELAAAALDLAFHAQHGHDSLSEDLRSRTLAAVKRAASAPQQPPLVAVAPLAAQSVATPGTLERERTAVGGGVRVREFVAWIAAAAALVALAVFFGRQPTLEERSPFEIARQLEADPNVTRVAWAPGNNDLGRGVTGEVVWSDQRQQGVMKFRGLKANDPRQEQYQLWIFDAERDEKYPVDGGVFDIPAGEDEVFVAIDPRVPVAKATLFAISVERPGGTVVSDRSRLPLVAPVPAGAEPGDGPSGEAGDAAR